MFCTFSDGPLLWKCGNITCSCRHCVGTARSVLCSCRTSGVRLVPEFRLPVMGLSEITRPWSSTECNGTKTLFNKACHSVLWSTFLWADKWKPHWTTIYTVLSSFCAFQRTLPDTESCRVAGHKAHSEGGFSEFFR